MPVISLDYELDVTFCPDGSYCCGNNNTACCNTDNANLEIFYNNPATIPLAPTSLSDYYSGLRLSTQSRSKIFSTSSSSSIQSLGTTSYGSQTALTPFSAENPILSTLPTPSSATSSSAQMALRSSSTAKLILSTSPTTSPATLSRISSSQSLTRPSGLYHNGKTAIEVAVPIAIILIVALATWKVLRRRCRGNAGMITEEEEQGSVNHQVPDQQSTTRELQSGLHRAELVTKHWDSVELPARRAPAELEGQIRDSDQRKRLQ